MNDMNSKTQIKLSKFLSLILRHQPEKIGLSLDAQGWVSIEQLLSQAHTHGQLIRHDELLDIVAHNDKQRFAISADGLRIRANQGHSLDVDLALSAQTPPNVLFHGTASRFLPKILAEGLQPMQRHHVHLSTNAEVALSVGARYGLPQLLWIDAQQMAADGHVFYCTDNGVWLTDHVAPVYIKQNGLH